MSRKAVVTESGRDEAGKFAVGNPGGPGRPARPVERQYLQTLGDAVTLQDWAEIVQRAVKDAKAGDAQARQWIARYTLGANPMGLFELARREALGVTVDAEIAAEVEEQEDPNSLDNLLEGLGGQTVLRRAMRLAKGQR